MKRKISVRAEGGARAVLPALLGKGGQIWGKTGQATCCSDRCHVSWSCDDKQQTTNLPICAASTSAHFDYNEHHRLRSYRLHVTKLARGLTYSAARTLQLHVYGRRPVCC